MNMFKRKTIPFTVEGVLRKLPQVPEGYYWRVGEAESWYYQTSGILREYSAGDYYLGFGVTLCRHRQWWIFKWDEIVARHKGEVERTEKDVLRVANELVAFIEMGKLREKENNFRNSGELTANTHKNLHWIQRYKWWIIVGVWGAFLAGAIITAL